HPPLLQSFVEMVESYSVQSALRHFVQKRELVPRQEHHSQTGALNQSALIVCLSQRELASLAPANLPNVPLNRERFPASSPDYPPGLSPPSSRPGPLPHWSY